MNKVFKLFTLFFGIFLFLGGIITNISELRARNWPSTKATIISSEISEADYKKRFIEIKIIYEYNLDKTYKSHQISFNDTRKKGTTRAYEKKIFYENLFKLGNEIKIFYNPQNPSESIVEKNGFSSFSLIWGGIFCIIFSTKYRRKNESRKHTTRHSKK